MQKNQIFNLTLTSIFASIILLMSLLPQVGFVTLMPGVSVTLVHIPVLIGVFLLPRNHAITLGLFFGLGSMIASYLYAANPIDLAFQLPWISVLPRVLFAAAAYYIFKYLKRIETSFKFGKTLIFGIVAFVTVFAVYYGSQAVITQVSYDEYNQTNTSIFVKQSTLDDPEQTLTPQEILVLEAEIDALETSLPTVLEDAVQKEVRLQGIITPIAFIIIVLFLSSYYHFIIKNKNQEILYPSVFILSTVVHTVLVLSALVIFKPALFGEAAGNVTSVLTIIYTIAAANGLIEALVAVFVGTPIVLAIQQVQKQNL